MAEHARGIRLGSRVLLDFVIPHGRWVDLDTLVESTCRGLRDAGALAPRYAGLDAIVATKRFGDDAGVVVRPLADAGRQPPGTVALDVASDVVPRPGWRDAKRGWRSILADAWGGRPPLGGAVWAEVTLAGAGSLLGPLEVVLDALEPVLGRDPRGRDWQEFFPHDDRIEWLAVDREPAGPPLRLRIGAAQ